MSYPAAPPYGRKTAYGIIEKVKESATFAKRCDLDPVDLKLTQRELTILANMLYEMDRHLPDFFEEIEDE